VNGFFCAPLAQLLLAVAWPTRGTLAAYERLTKSRFHLASANAAADAVYVLSMYETGSAASQQEAQQWVAHTAACVQTLAAGSSSEGQAASRAATEQPPGVKVQQGTEAPEPFRLREGKQRYLQNIGSCMQVR
jgi:hypothetical protein